MTIMEATNSSKTRREAALLVLVVFLLGLLVGGVGNHLWGERVWGRQQIGPHQGPPSREEIVNRLTVELQLTPDQQKQIGPIIDDTRSQVRALYEPVDAEHDKIRQQGRARIRAVLTVEQQPKFDQFLQRMDEQKKKEAAHQR
jgi:Spy/CpxP family protein refolding chaperone